MPERKILPIIDIDICSGTDLEVNLIGKEEEISLENIKVITSGFVPDYYEGEYIVDPSFEEQVLETKEKVMRDDVSVKPIEVSRTDNLSGGITVYIGGILDG